MDKFIHQPFLTFLSDFELPFMTSAQQLEFTFCAVIKQRLLLSHLYFVALTNQWQYLASVK